MNESSESREAASTEARQRIARFHDQIQNRDHFQLFGIDRDTDLDQIRGIYKELAKRWHADAYTGLDLGSAKPKLDEIFQRIAEAYETLTTPAKRNEYLVLLDRQRDGKVTDISAVFQSEQLVDEAMTMIRRRDWPGAEEKLEEAIRLNPDDPLFRASLAWVRFHQNKRNARKVEECLDLLKAAVKEQENLPLGYLYLGNIYFAQEKYDHAKKWWKLCLEWDANNIEAQRGLRLVAQRADKQQKKSGLAGFFGKLFKK